MKLPPKDDPSGDREGALPRERVILVLEANDVQVNQWRDGLYSLELDDNVAHVVRLKPIVGGIQIRFLARRFGLRLVDFYFENADEDPGPPN